MVAVEKGDKDERSTSCSEVEVVELSHRLIEIEALIERLELLVGLYVDLASLLSQFVFKFLEVFGCKFLLAKQRGPLDVSGVCSLIE